MRYYQLEIGWNKYLFKTPHEAADIMSTLLDVPNVDTLWSAKGVIYYHKAPTPTITVVDIEEILPTLGMAERVRDYREVEPPPNPDPHVTGTDGNE